MLIKEIPEMSLNLGIITRKELEISKLCNGKRTVQDIYEELSDTYSDIEDKDGNKIFGKKSKIIERALELLDNYFNPKENDIDVIWCRAREELNMLLVGKTTFLSYITGNRKKVYSDNIAIEVIEWYIGKRKEEMDLEVFLKGLKGMW